MTFGQPPLLQALVGDEEIAAFFSDEADLEAMLQVEAALAGAQAEAGFIDGAAAQRIADTCDSFRPDWDGLARGLAQDGVVIPELVRQLRRAVGEAHSGAVHKGATSQDIIDTSLMIRLKAVAAVLGSRIDGLSDALGLLQSRDGMTTLMAHTRMQRALPFTARDKITTWTGPLRRLRAQLDSRGAEWFALQLGGPVGTRGELDGSAEAVPAGMARRLGLNLTPAWHSQRDRIGDFASWLSLVSGALGKIGQDVALMAQNEVGEVRLAGGGGSSAMPHKANPVAAEILVTLARFNAGSLGTLHQALVHENERSGAAWTLEWMVLPSIAVTTAAGLRHAQALVTHLAFVAKPEI
ncbi:3-carboxy-cis,cis-muconate cycloisomerase [Microvirga pudoricolor]|uniref:3-carboxy-cis,cis-muconate cycloisomerase n=1 Tax=Microvirga pudoricolor TaxID=2778729 RepID=UPI00194FFD6C|nr:3-carboxy-cis,cis-muconate cycloisomerase [Microvirga pudoricolor]MBM6594850.1 3-carboxy-cis,cis-muconate cycloisomerase [Microvirga pudoricolor]